MPSKIRELLDAYRFLAKTSVRELWLVYFSKLLESLAYFTMVMVMVLYFTYDLGLGDKDAGKLFGYWSLGYGILIFLAGALCDAIGIKLSLLLGFLFCVLGRLLFSFFPNYELIAFVALPCLAIGLPLMVPIKSAAIKQYTVKDARPLAFGIFYALMNIGAFLAGLCLDQLTWLVRTLGGTPKGEVIKKGGRDITRYVVTLGRFELSSYQLIFLFGFLTTLLGFLVIALFVRKNIHAEEDIEALNRVKRQKNPLRLLLASMSKRIFWVFFFLIALVSIVKLLFTHVHITMPKFMLREIGADAAVGKTYSINGFLLMLLPPLLSVHLSRFRPLSVILVGSLISASSPFFLAIDPRFYAPLAHSLGIHPLYLPIILFYVVLSLGEALWGPKLYEYTAAIAPQGEESTYMAVSTLPWVLAKLPAGLLSGYLLEAYCPEEGRRQSTTLWLIIGLITLSAPLGLFLFRHLFRSIVPSRSP